MKGLVLGLSVNTFSAKLSKIYVLQLENTWGEKKAVGQNNSGNNSTKQREIKEKLISFKNAYLTGENNIHIHF